MENDTLNNLQDRINQKLRVPRYDIYEIVHVLLIYWRDGHEGYRMEGQRLREYLEHELGYIDVEEYPIPAEDSYLALDGYIGGSILKINQLVAKKQSSALLIIHYGGHGDEDDDKSLGQERRSVWAQ